MAQINMKDLDDLFEDINGLSDSNNNVEVVNIVDNKKESIEEPVEAPKEKPIKAVKKEKEVITDISNDEDNVIGILQSGQVKMDAIAQEMNFLYVERDVLIKLMQLSLVTNSNLLMLGPPGSAKSDITYEFCSRIQDANYFQWMLNKTSDPSEILGSFSIKEMENDKFMRVTKGKLPEANIAFIDEIFKSNAPVLNALLTIMNEHIFYNDGQAVPVPLITMIGASNEPPEDESLNAMYDRFIFRINVQYVSDIANKKRMHSNYINKRAGKLNKATKTTITLHEIEVLRNAAKTVKVSRDIINAFIRLINELAHNGIHVSDRRQNECFKIMQGNAVLRGDNKVILDDFESLIYVLWEKEDQISGIESTISKIINPYNDVFREIKEKFNEMKTKINNANPSDKVASALTSRKSIDKLMQKVNKLINDANKNNKDTTQYIQLRDEINDYVVNIIQDALGTTMGEFVAINDDDNITSNTNTNYDYTVISDNNSAISSSAITSYNTYNTSTTGNYTQFATKID